MGEISKPVTGALEGFEAASGARDTDEGRITRVRAVGDGLEEGRPLQAVVGVEVEDVDVAVAIHSLEDGLVCSEVREAEEWGHLIEQQVG